MDIFILKIKGNIALNKVARQSVNYKDKAEEGFTADKAVDGKTTREAASCTHTKEPGPAWQVNLGKQYVVTGMKVINRGDCCQCKYVIFSNFICLVHSTCSL